MKTDNPNTKSKKIKESDFSFLLELTDDELDKLAGGETKFANNKSDFYQSF